MTDEHAIKLIQEIEEDGIVARITPEHIEAFGLAIKALETGEVYMTGEDYNLYIEGYKAGKKDFEPKQGEWIPVSERLPERYEEVIVTDIETSETYVSRYIGDGYWECDNGPFNNRIIAWQEKPEPYKKGGDKMFDDQFFAQQGWQCPICKRVYSPTTAMCYYCGSQETITTTTVTVNPQDGWWELLPTILTSYPPKYMWQCQRCGHEIITDDRSYPQSPCEKCGAGSKGGEKNDT